MKKTYLLFVALMAFSYTAIAQTVAATAKMNQFIDQLMQKMTLDEKIGQLNLLTPGGGIPTGSVVSTDVETKIKKGQVGGLFGVIGADKVLQAQRLAVEKSRLHIPLIFGSDVIHGHKTTFPIPLGLACSWDTTLIKQTARAAAEEATADGLSWAFSPMVDICRDPRWGRIAEGAGEDAFLGSAIAGAMVRGYQQNNLRQDNTVMACVKHFALYGAAEGGRDYNTVDMSRIRMYNEYLPPYKAAIDAGVGSVMSSFNVIDDIPATGNRWLLTDLLRKQWQFNGFVVSDYTSVNEMEAHGLGNLQQVSALALKAGLDMDMVGEGFLTTLKKSLQQGKVILNDINTACRRILEAKYKLGLFENPYRNVSSERAAVILSPDHLALSRKAAAKACVLLKNNHNVLPLQRKGTIALVGPLADSRRNMLGTWSVAGDWHKAITLKEGMEKLAADQVKIIYAKGANISDDTLFNHKVNVFGPEIEMGPASSDAMIQEAVAAAQKADVVVAALGEAADMSGESSSRADIGLPESQQKLLKALVQTGKPVVIVLFNGRPLTLVKESQMATAILDAWFGGTEAGNGIADVLFGVENPSGKLTASFPYSVGQIPVYYNHLNTGRPYVLGGPTKFKSDYLDIPNAPLFPFGYGLSYTRFLYSPITLSDTILKNGTTIHAMVKVTNSGNYDGEELVQLYLRDEVASISRPVKMLKGFQKIVLKKGETKTVDFPIQVDALKFYNSRLEPVAEPGKYEVMIGTNSDVVQTASFTFNNR
ncbi:beta-glucosidase BglX [Hydrotalea sp.]|uniref:beta-glucosidase BglX n=1 Tax=Hydrotalea sp. TaxID=2881279 RepID=UPI0026106545|nr:beta-glucosidase BglX [Hydrotalea sp.]